MELSERSWGEFRIEDIFNIDSGTRLTRHDFKIGKTPFVSATEMNNGVTSFISNMNSSYDKNVLGVNYNGSVVHNFYHPYNALFSDDVKRLKLKEIEGNEYIYLFIKAVILKQKPKYQYGYKFNASRMKAQIIKLPVNERNEPDYPFMELYMKQVEKRRIILSEIFNSSQRVSIDVPPVHGWKVVKITDLFDIIQRGKRLTKKDQKDGDVPYVSSTERNNGVDSFISNDTGVRHFKNCLTLANSGSVGATFYHPYEFVASDHVTALVNESYNSYIYLFIAKMVKNQMRGKYSFNREISDKRIKNERIMLPVTESGELDFVYMESYMKQKEYDLYKKLS